MTSDPAVQWAATVIFGTLSAWSLWRLTTTRRLLVAASHLFHLGMSLAMVVMVWPCWVRLPALPQVAFFAVGAACFAAAAGWYGIDALSRPAGSRGPTPDRRRAGHHESARCQATHAVMMLAMVWALAVMTRHGGPAVGHAAEHAAVHGAVPAPLDALTAAGGAVLVVLLVVGGALFLVAAVRHTRSGGAARDRAGLDHAGLDLMAGGLMSFGTAAMCGLMLAG
ncbi:DUF5134 domain-containing protein [Promicromonospora sp. MEB111]|uniref:DUF5134 domain-containing protein n=1 Tax=Promicromonospora sp. MEB111 TaxID=3040301 RepID=UPI00254AA456|nr:DUF5134 domain-containing protein [Promicromonospora sp. MEB111]